MSERIAAHEQKGNALLWFAVLAGPSAWTLQTYVGAYLTDALCLRGAGATQGHVYSLDHPSFVVLISAVATAVALVGLGVSLVAVRRHQATDDPTTGRRALWMAHAGVLLNILFLIAIVFMFVAPYYLEECVRPL
jgi:uncharacterized membrane protein